MKNIINKSGFICDMDGVIYHGNKILDGVAEFVNWMLAEGKNFIFLTNSPEKTPHELSMKLERMGLSVSADHFYTTPFIIISQVEANVKRNLCSFTKFYLLNKK